MRKAIRRFLNQFGYEIIKVSIPHSGRTTRAKVVRVGNYEMSMPSNNIQLDNYKTYPGLNSQIGRLAIIISKKYPGMTVIDVGANVGDTIAVLKSAIDLPVIGIEGDDISWQYLEKNIKQFSNVSIVKTFLSEKKQDVKVAFEKSGWNTTIIPDKEGGKLISFITLDEVIETHDSKPASIKLLKIDVEGFDTIVLRGAYDTIQKYKPVLYFEYNPENMDAINEDGLSTLLSFEKYSYNKIAFFDHIGRLLLVTSVKNAEAITCLHNYAAGKNNRIGYYDICIFHEEDDRVAVEFIAAEEKYTAAQL